MSADAIVPGIVPAGSVPQPVAALASMARAVRSGGDPSRPVMLGIVGPPGSGKSTLTQALRAELGDWALVQMDGFHLANQVLESLGRRDRKGAPDTFDVAGFVALLERVRVRSRGVVYAPEFRREIEEPIASALAVEATVPGVIVEGNYLLVDSGGWQHVAGLLDEIWYVDTPPDQCRRRLVERQSVTYGPEAGARWVDTVDEPNAAVVRATRERADRLVQLEAVPPTSV